MATSGEVHRYIVRAEAGSLPDVVRELKAIGGQVGRTLDLIDAAVVDPSGAELAAAQNLPHVLAVTADETLQPQTTTAPVHAAADANSMYSIGDITGARDVWTTAASPERASTSPCSTPE